MRKNKQIRIISGEFGGRLIDTPDNTATQPMGDRERMAIFNRLREEIAGKKVADVFAGSGALGLEALSLGASEVIFVEKDPKAILCIKQNLQKLGWSARVQKKLEEECDIIFMDPPYNNPQYELCAEIAKHLKPDGYLVLSHPANPEPPVFDGLELVSDKKYAAACIKIYRKK